MSDLRIIPAGMRTVLRSIALALLVLAPAAPAAAHAPGDAVGGRAVAAPESRAETIAARTRFFGRENVNRRTGAVRPTARSSRGTA